MSDKKYKKHLTVWVIATVLLCGIFYYIGNKHGKSSFQSNFAQMRGQQGAQRTGGRFNTGNGAFSGKVTAKDESSMTIQTRDGSSKIVLFTGSTQVLKSSAGIVDDVSVGTQISAIGTQNSDGSITAQSIQIRPDMPEGSNAAQKMVQ